MTLLPEEVRGVLDFAIRAKPLPITIRLDPFLGFDDFVAPSAHPKELLYTLYRGLIRRRIQGDILLNHNYLWSGVRELNSR